MTISSFVQKSVRSVFDYNVSKSVAFSAFCSNLLPENSLETKVMASRLERWFIYQDQLYVP